MTLVQPVLNALQNAPLSYQMRTNPMLFTVECLIKAIEARTMKPDIPVYRIPPGVNRSHMAPYERKLKLYRKAVKQAKLDQVKQYMADGFVQTRYFYQQLIEFEMTPASLSSVIGEMVYGMDVSQQVHVARTTVFNQAPHQDILQRSTQPKLTGLNLAESKLAAGDTAAASAIADAVIAAGAGKPDAAAATGHAYFILARVALMTGHPHQAFADFHETIANSKDPRMVSWSHIFMGRMLDLECKRSEAVAQYKAAMVTRDGRLDTLEAAEEGEKAPYTVNGHGCAATAEGGAPAPAKPAPAAAANSNVQDPAPKQQ